MGPKSNELWLGESAGRGNLLWAYSFSTYAKYSENLTVLTSWYAHLRVRIRRSLIHLMCVIACAPTSTRATSLMPVKMARTTSANDTFCLGHWNEENKRTKTSNSIVYHFTLTFVNFSLTLLYVHVWLQDKGKILIWSEYYNQFGIYQRSSVSLLEPQQKNFSNPEAYSEPYQTSKIEFFLQK